MKSSRRLNIITHDIKIHTANFIIYNLRKINSKIAKIINYMSKNNDSDLSTYVERYNIKLIKLCIEALESVTNIQIFIGKELEQNVNSALCCKTLYTL